MEHPLESQHLAEQWCVQCMKMGMAQRKTSVGSFMEAALSTESMTK